jgi:nucleoside-diphosphate-sugar epimerase
MAPKVAFITGGNGITGTAIVEYLARNTTAEQWSTIIVTSLSPLKSTVQDPRVKFIALDFQQDPDTLADQMRELCAPVTHAYFSSYVHRDNFAELNRANAALFENFLQALLKVARSLENCTLQTGGKYYNVHLQPVPSPAREDEPRRPSFVDNFYFTQEDALAAANKGQTWTWNVIRPEAIVGHTLKPNGMNSALTVALYFLVCKELNIEAKMPTNHIYWAGHDCVSDARLVADLSIFVSTNAKCANEAFNINNGDYFTWQYMWPRLAEFFGASATSDQVFTEPLPETPKLHQEVKFAEWAKDKRDVWDRICEKAGVPGAKETWNSGTWAFQDWVFERSWAGTLSVNKSRKFGWTGHMDSYESFLDAFKSFQELEQIPKST